MRPRVVLLACLAAILGASLLVVPAARAKLEALGTHTRAAVAGDASPSPTPGQAQVVTQAAPPEPELRAPADPASIKQPGGTSFFGWAFLDRSTGTITGSANSATSTNTTESMVKAWIASDYLRRQGDDTPSDPTMLELTLMIIDSNDDLAEKYYEQDGSNAVIQRMISMCGLTHTTIYPYWWSKTQMTAQDAVKYGLCVANGTAAGTKWTQWILTTMQHVRGGVADQISVTKQGGRWGIIDGLPANLVAGTSIKNGWTTGYSDGWHIDCMAINAAWVLNVMVRVSGLQTGANACASVAKQLTYTPDV
jgi:hypothetical protein